MGNRYVVEFSGTPSSPNDLITCISGAGRRIRCVQMDVAGAGASSAAQGLKLCRSTGGTTPGAPVTPSKGEHTDQPAANFTTATTWAAQPTAEANGHMVGYNALGPGRWQASAKTPPVEARNGENISVRALAGFTYQATKISLVIEED